MVEGWDGRGVAGPSVVAELLGAIFEGNETVFRPEVCCPVVSTKWRWVCADVWLSLAFAEIYISIATLVMRFDFELYETTRDDVDFHHDFTISHPKLDSKYIRVLIK